MPMGSHPVYKQFENVTINQPLTQAQLTVSHAQIVDSAVRHHRDLESDLANAVIAQAVGNY